MKKINLIILIIGLIIILIIIGGITFKLVIKKKPAAVPPITPPSIAVGEEKIVSRFMGLSPNEIPGVYKEKITLYKENLKNDCLNKKEQVKEFLLNNNDENILKEMKEIAVSPDLIPLKVVLSSDLVPIPLKVTPEGEGIEFKINKQIVFECLNLNKDEFKSCQAKLNGLEINNQNIENYINTKVDIGRLIQRYLEWEAIKQSDENICQKLNFYKIIAGDYDENTLKNNINRCIRFTQSIRFITNVYAPILTCENLCQKITIDSADNCLISCQAIKNNDISKCDSLSDTISKAICKAIISFDPKYCDTIQPRIIDVYEEGKIIKEDQATTCKIDVYAYNAVKQNKESLIKESNKYKMGDIEENEYIDKLYFQKENADFDKDYTNYCNLKYSL